MAPPPTTRLAPSPTGALHLGNALTFLVNWALARKLGWRVILRIEDLDGPRLKRGADRQAIDILGWLGLDWDGDPIYQTADLTPYLAAMERLREQGDIYPCDATRKQIEAALSAPNEGEHELRYPGPRKIAEAKRAAEGGTADTASNAPPPGDVPLLEEGDYAWRLRVPDEEVAFDDTLRGPQSINVQQQVGDFVVATKQGLPAYQLAVVVDDARQGVTHVVRGDDLLPSTARQALLYDRLGLCDLRPAYTHLPLVYGEDGRRLAKRHGDTRVSAYRERGVPRERIIGLLAYYAGLATRPEPMSAGRFAEALDPARLHTQPIQFTDKDDAWLLQSSD